MSVPRPCTDSGFLVAESPKRRRVDRLIRIARCFYILGGAGLVLCVWLQHAYVVESIRALQKVPPKCSVALLEGVKEFQFYRIVLAGCHRSCPNLMEDCTTAECAVAHQSAHVFDEKMNQTLLACPEIMTAARKRFLDSQRAGGAAGAELAPPESAHFVKRKASQ